MSLVMRVWLLVIWIAVPNVFPCLGQGTDPEEENIPEIEEQIVVTAQLIPEKTHESLYRVKIIGKERLNEQAPTTLRELLSQELSLNLTQHSVFGSGLSLQGVSGENVKILRDGIPVIGRLNGIIDLDQINTQGLDRIEIIEGPVSIFHGSDAMGGVVNLISRAPDDQGLKADLSSYYRTAGEHTNELSAGLVKNAHAFAFQAASRDFQGYARDDGTRRLDWAERDQAWGSLRYSHAWQNLRLSYKADMFRESLLDRGEPSGEGIARDADYRTERSGHHLVLSGPVGSKYFLDTQLSFSGYRRDRIIDRIDAFSGSVVDEGEPDQETRFGHWLGRTVIDTRGNGRFGFQAGFELSLEKGTGGRLLDDRQRQNDQALFAALRWTPTPRFRIQPSLRYGHNSNYGELLTPAVHFKFDASKNIGIRSSFAEGYRSPSLKETFLDFTMAAGPFVYHIIGNPNLEPERGRNLQTSMITRHSLKKMGRLSMEYLLFDNRIDHLIALSELTPELDQPNRFQREYINIASHRSRGGQVNVSLAGSTGKAELGLSRTEASNQLHLDGNVPEFSGRYDGRFHGSLSLNRLGAAIHLFYKVQGRRPGFIIEDARIQEVYIQSAQWLDLSVSRKLFGDILKVQAGGKNLLDTRNLNTVDVVSGSAHSRSHADWGRTYYFQIQLSWRS